ncbi:GTPase [Caldisphaera sp.]|uniref:GTPase n=1 Tax=Caldisphaera sp. TaxID=2060322 RepID=UPI003D0F43C5
MKETIMDPAGFAKEIQIPLYNEILEKIKSRYQKKGGKEYEREIMSIELVYNVINSKTLSVLKLEKLLKNLHHFYWGLIEVNYDKKKIYESIKCIKKSRTLLKKFWINYRNEILAANNSKEMKSLSREARGRMISSIKKCSKSLEYLRNLVITMSSFPGLDPYRKTLIVAGPPNAGKSTIVSTITNAKTKIASYPFTTKDIIIGHFTLDNGQVIQVIDTPGLLDRNINEMNEIERKAISALKYLDGLILFLMDPSKEAYMNLDKQINIINDIKSIILNKKIILIINKIDLLNEIEIKDVEKAINESANKLNFEAYYKISALNKKELIDLINNIVKSNLLAS